MSKWISQPARLTLLLGFLLAGCVGIGQATPAPPPQDQPAPFYQPIEGTAPKIEFANLEHDFGLANQRISLKHSFSFKNVGNGELIIEKVKSG
ncbi:MAG: DUF1573 domain-containing protein [Acidobacteria bacterium]|nr:DUF1573 domain-containing protein [Acidobacteriota bacterium]